jgi:hypothetical protein
MEGMTGIMGETLISGTGGVWNQGASKVAGDDIGGAEPGTGE